jgi:membrane-bound metal-dependent hydrolase YbcI (DUF457 family)
MLGRSHIMCGLIAGVGEAAALDHAPLLVRLLIVPVTGGAALLNDIDKPGSRVARSFGPLTTWIAHGVAALSVMVYDATRTELDPQHCDGGHRTLTHTLLWGVIVGVMTGVMERVHPVLGVIDLTLLVGVMTQGSEAIGRGVTRFIKALKIGFTVTLKALGIGFTLAAAVVSWIVVTHDQTWWWVWPVSVTMGSWVHIAGDAMTPSGVPLARWPMTRHGRRWSRVHTPATFHTGGHVETGVVTPILGFMLLLSAGFATGVIPAVVHAVHL